MTIDELFIILIYNILVLFIVTNLDKRRPK
jgi:hypothetical protein